MDGGNLVPKEGRPLPPASIITREARYSQARRDYARRPGTRASRHSARGRQEPGQALGQDRAGSSRATAAGSSRREAGKLQGMSIPALHAPLVASSWRRPGGCASRPGVPGQPGVGPLRHAAAWCLPGALASRGSGLVRAWPGATQGPAPLVTAPGRPPGLVRLAGATRVQGRCGRATGGAVRRCDRPPGGGATGGARRRPPGLGLLAFG